MVTLPMTTPAWLPKISKVVLGHVLHLFGLPAAENAAKNVDLLFRSLDVAFRVREESWLVGWVLKLKRLAVAIGPPEPA